MKFLKNSILILLTISITIACTSDPKGDEAKVSEAEEVTAIEGTELMVKSENAEMEFVGTKPTGRHYGNIALSDGMIKLNDGEITGGKFVFNLNQITITDLKDDKENHNKLVSHLKSDEFFDVENYPKVTFELVSIKPLNNNGNAANSYKSFQDDMKQPAANEKIMELPNYELAGATHEIIGNLTMRGKTLAITVPARISNNNGNIEAFTNFSIDRTKWGLMYRDESKAVDKAKDQFIYNRVGIGFNLKASTQNM